MAPAATPHLEFPLLQRRAVVLFRLLEFGRPFCPNNQAGIRGSPLSRAQAPRLQCRTETVMSQCPPTLPTWVLWSERLRGAGCMARGCGAMRCTPEPGFFSPSHLCVVWTWHPWGQSGFLWDPVSPWQPTSLVTGHGPLVCIWAEVFVYDLIFICASFGNLSSQQVPVQCLAMGREGLRAGWKCG